MPDPTITPTPPTPEPLDPLERLYKVEEDVRVLNEQVEQLGKERLPRWPGFVATMAAIVAATALVIGVVAYWLSGLAGDVKTTQLKKVKQDLEQAVTATDSGWRDSLGKLEAKLSNLKFEIGVLGGDQRALAAKFRDFEKSAPKIAVVTPKPVSPAPAQQPATPLAKAAASPEEIAQLRDRLTRIEARLRALDIENGALRMALMERQVSFKAQPLPRESKLTAPAIPAPELVVPVVAAPVTSAVAPPPALKQAELAGHIQPVITLRVVNPAGQPIRGVKVSLFFYDTEERLLHSQPFTTGDSGTIASEAVPGTECIYARLAPEYLGRARPAGIMKACGQKLRRPDGAGGTFVIE